MKISVYKFFKSMLLLAAFTDFNYFFLPFLNFDLAVRGLVITLIACICFLFCVLNSNIYSVIRKYTKYLNIYLVCVGIILLLEYIYSIMTYPENLLDMMISTRQYFYILLAYPMIYIFIRDGGFDKFLHTFFYMSTALSAILIIQAFFYNYTGLSLLKGFGETARNGKVRVYYVSILCAAACIYYMSKIITEFKTLYLMAAFINIFNCYYVIQSRVLLVSVIFALLAMLFVNKKRMTANIGNVFLLMVGIVVLVASQFVNTMFSSIMDTGINNTYSVRIMGLNYYAGLLKENYIFGMGIVREKNIYLYSILHGPYNVAFLEDLGILGLLFRFGLLSLPIILMLYIRMIMSYAKNKGHLSYEYRLLMVGFFSFLIISSISLSVFDPSRTFIVPIAFSVLEYISYRCKEHTMIVRRVPDRIRFRRIEGI